ncbi:riboflavin synthase [Rathayibacter soli]|uniref:riboflavin synthase n=1 Tax=Rathayibacter soli TaxID=3144168 RepID=UPI0027E3F735|nr:riboflavin synthase [Glaciibacter superstes]
MFTGIIEEVGEITDVQRTADAARITVRGPLVVSDARHGDSISVSGVCLTVVDHTADSFTADVMAETLTMSTLGTAAIGRRVNLERAAAVGDRIGGHIVQGHIDGTARILSTTDGGAWRIVRLSLAAELAPLVVRKGSIAIDGISLTVSAVGADSDAPGLRDAWFEVSLIPETLTATTLGEGVVGDAVNIETDILARHVERMLSVGALASSPISATAGAHATALTNVTPLISDTALTNDTAESDRYHARSEK